MSKPSLRLGLQAVVFKIPIPALDTVFTVTATSEKTKSRQLLNYGSDGCKCKLVIS